MSLALVIKGGGMKLYEFHIVHRSFGPIDHSLAIAGSYHGVGCGLINSSAAAGAYQRDLT